MKCRSYYVLFLFLLSFCFSASAYNAVVKKYVVLSEKNNESPRDAFCSLVSIIGEGILQSSIQLNQCIRFDTRTNKTFENHCFSGSFSDSILRFASDAFSIKNNSSLSLNQSLPFYIAYRRLII